MRKLLSVLFSTLQGGVRRGLLLLLLVASMSAIYASDTQVDGIWYDFDSSTKTASVTYRGSYYDSYADEYSDSVAIPETVIYNGTTYNVTSIGDYAFKDCSSLTSITIPNSVTSIEDYTFQRCSSLTSITIPNSVTSIGRSAFYKCSSLASITIPNSVTSIGDYAFYNCSSLTSIVIPESVKSIGVCAFSYCSSLTSIVIGNGVTSIGEGAFARCSSLTSITIPNSVTSIGKWAFEGCSSLTSITIPNSVTNIGEGAFEGCSSLTSITIPESVTSIGKSAFSDCSSLTSITIPNSVTSIGSWAFSYCSSLTSVTIGASVTSIGDYAFCDCTSLTSVTIPNSVTSIGMSAFSDCSSLTSPVYNAHCFAYMPTSYSGAYTIPEGIEQIAGGAFSSCSSLTSVTIPNSVTSIGNYAFYNCTSLTSITCEAETPPTLGSDAFYAVSKSIPVYVPCGCVEAYKAASGWNDFTNIHEPLAEYSIQVSTSNSQMGSAIVVYNTSCGAQISATANYGYHFVCWSDGNTDNPRTLTLTQDTALTAEFALTIAGQCGDNLYWSYNETAKTISITGSGEMYDYTADTQPWFLFKEQIVEVTTNNTVTSIGTSAFEGCVRLAKISLGTGLEKIAANAFAGCTRLYDIYVYATYPPFAEESSFANYNVYVYIPCEYQRNYILDVVWGNFKFIECLESEETTTDGNVTVVPGTNDVTITWPTETGADSYTIVIKKGDTVFCTLTFNADGQLLNIAFAPGRNDNHPAQYAEQAGNGYRFTVTGLEEGTHYTYNIDVQDVANNTIKSHAGEFTTESTTAVENTHSQSSMTNCKKIIRNDQLLILRDGVEYTIMGQEL